MFLDVENIYCKAGEGGDGKVSFHREKYVTNGGPDGGDGGNGGSIYFMADASMNTLISFRYTKKFRAQNGANGDQKNCVGKSGEDLIIKVPCGTVLKDAESGSIIADIFHEGEKVLILEGGKGGRGNARFASATRKAPGFSEMGQKTVQRKITLELKTIADVGLIGFPNVGKSTLLSVISAARPKIANYHFTTLTPNIGMVRYGASGFAVADIPGLIEGAADGVGLGHDFLRHIERVRMLVHLVDISGHEGRNPAEDYLAVRKELERFNPALSTLPEVVVANKCDIGDYKENLIKLKEVTSAKIMPISAVTRMGVDELLGDIVTRLQTLPPVKPIEFEPFRYEEPDRAGFEIVKEKDAYRVTGGLMEDLARRVVLSDAESFRWFQRVLRDKGVIKELKAKGAADGDTVKILDIAFEYCE